MNTTMEKIEPIIDSPAPLNSCLRVLTSPSLSLGIESKTDFESPIEDGVAEIIAEIEKPNITKHSIVMNAATDAMKYFCCFGTADFLITIFFINFSVKPALTSSSFKMDNLS